MIDFVLLAVIGISTLLGVMRGFVSIVISTFSWLLGGWAALMFGKSAASATRPSGAPGSVEPHHRSWRQAPLYRRWRGSDHSVPPPGHAHYHGSGPAAFDDAPTGLWQNDGLPAHSALPMTPCCVLFPASRPAPQHGACTRG